MENFPKKYHQFWKKFRNFAAKWHENGKISKK